MLKESQLHEYQHLVVNHILKNKRAAVWAAMGLGKTVSTLTAVERLQFCGYETKPTLVLAPLRVARSVWPKEVKGWEHLAHMKVVPILGTAVERRDALFEKADIFTCNFENLDWLIKTHGDHWPYGMIVIDESTKLKSLRANIRKNEQGTMWVQGQGGKRAKSLLQTVFKFKTERIVELTGTPSPNGLQDLWGQIFFLDYGKRLGRVFDAYRQRYFRPSFNAEGYIGGYDALPTAQAEIERHLRDIVISLRTEDWFDLAKPIVRNIYVDLPAHAMKQYREMEKQLYTEIKGNPVEALTAGARTQKCLQMAAGAAYLGDPKKVKGPREWVEVHEEKLNALEEIEEEAAGMPLLVGYHFKSDLVRLKKRFPKGRELDNRQSTEDEWNLGRIPMLFVHAASAGHGLNLQRGSNILVRYSCDWNAEQFAQIAERVGPVRQAQAGLNRNCYVYNIVARHTVDEDVYESHDHKLSAQDALMMGIGRRMRAYA